MCQILIENIIMERLPVAVRTAIMATVVAVEMTHTAIDRAPT